MAGTVARLFVYPVKGCVGTALGEARLLERGIEHDRRWMVVDRNGRFVTQRELPALARVRPSIANGRLSLLLPNGATVEVPISDEGEPVRVRVWRDEVKALVPSADADTALTRCFDRPLRLVRFPEATRRPCDPTYAPDGSHTGFADGFPLLVTSESSLAELNDALLEQGEEPVPMDRFRPNLVLAGLPPGAEDRASRIRFSSGLELLLVKPCARCIVTTTDQTTGERRGPEPIATLRRIRRAPDSGEVLFGQNAVPVLLPDGGVRIATGEPCELG